MTPSMSDLPIARWTGPARVRFAVGDHLNMSNLMDPEAPTISTWMQERTREAIADLDRQVAEAATQVPSGQRLCVHGIEMLRTMNGEYLSSDRVNIAWQQRAHLVPRGELCTEGGPDRRLYLEPGEVTAWVVPS